ncbi:glycogenin-1-like isoform X4 [Eriocheir sinensis]|uniref:glycogenin-1-like isoform X4 n=1 Tax=Eriocheir sinensis TaxID=95602 RepID=UPI0021C9D667|nr:glycogenin-1-like isoform X4 [Eriocheir sinensis]
MSEAYVTLATNDGYAVGALVLGHSLRSNNTSRDLIVMIAPAVSPAIRSLLEGVFNKVVVVDVLDSGDSAHLALMKRPELGITFTKLHCWTFTEYSKCVFLDADMLCVQNPDDLFSHPELTAACDVGWPDCFNSGMFVFAPSQDTYNRLLQHAETAGSFDGGDQGLLNTFFTDWHRVSFVYNMVASATYTYLPAYKQYGGDAKLIHFLGALKPWQHRYDSNTGNVDTPAGYQHLAPYLNSWWAIYNRLVKPGVPDVVASQFSTMTVHEESLEEGKARWERGQPDYLGRDSFDNIKAYIDNKLKSNGK